jgi:hypothetical protein
LWSWLTLARILHISRCLRQNKILTGAGWITCQSKRRA